MNRTVLGAVGALLLAAAGLFWWQGRAAVEAPWADLSGDIPGAGATATRTETLLQGAPAWPHREYRVRLVE